MLGRAAMIAVLLAPTASIAVLLRSEGPGSGRATSVISPDPRNSNAASRPAVRTVTAVRPSVAITGTPTRASTSAVLGGGAYSSVSAPVPAVPAAGAPSPVFPIGATRVTWGIVSEGGAGRNAME